MSCKTRLRLWVLTLFFAVFTGLAGAQSLPLSNKLWSTTVYIESVYQRPAASPKVKDTLAGTAFLIADGDKVYLVTAKHLIVAAINGKDQQSANNSLFISANWANNGQAADKPIKLEGLSGWDVHKRPFVFSPDKLDIAIISFQKNKYKNVLAAILKNNRKPVMVDSIDVSNDHHPGDALFVPTYFTYKNKKGVRGRTEGIGRDKIKTFGQASPLFTIEGFVNQGHNGAPVYINDKMIGMLTNQEGVLTNADIIREPYRTAKSAKAIKVSYILPLLRKLQQNEHTPGFN